MAQNPSLPLGNTLCQPPAAAQLCSAKEHCGDSHNPARVSPCSGAHTVPSFEPSPSVSSQSCLWGDPWPLLLSLETQSQLCATPAVL